MIVVVAIVCIVVAVLSSAQRADKAVTYNERQSRAPSNFGERILREVSSVACTNSAMQNFHFQFDPVRSIPS